MTSQWFSLFIELQPLFALLWKCSLLAKFHKNVEVQFQDVVEFLDEDYLEFLHEGYMILSLFFVRIAS